MDPPTICGGARQWWRGEPCSRFILNEVIRNDIEKLMPYVATITRAQRHPNASMCTHLTVCPLIPNLATFGATLVLCVEVFCVWLCGFVVVCTYVYMCEMCVCVGVCGIVPIDWLVSSDCRLCRFLLSLSP